MSSFLASLLVASAIPGFAGRASPPPEVIGCYVLRLGPSVSSDTSPVNPPAVLDLRPGGLLATAQTIDDSLVAPEAPIWGWRQSGHGVVDVWWSAGWIGGRIDLHLHLAPGGLRGRYSLHYHQVDDGRLLWRGNALAIRVPCVGPNAASEDAHAAVRTLIRWEGTQLPDTAAALAEATREFLAFLRDTPVHSLSVVNYRIAEFTCRHGRLPRDLAELQAADTTPSYLAALEARSYKDAWNRSLRYSARPPGYEVRSAGPDGRFDTRDDLVSVLAEPLRRDPEHDCR